MLALAYTGWAHAALLEAPSDRRAGVGWLVTLETAVITPSELEMAAWSGWSWLRRAVERPGT
ncbi:MAG: hypothetical protein AMXMBFR64_62370 [Myxococcales bacterium]